MMRPIERLAGGRSLGILAGHPDVTPPGRWAAQAQTDRSVGWLQVRMGVLVQIRDVPEPVHSVLKARAACWATAQPQTSRSYS